MANWINKLFSSKTRQDVPVWKTNNSILEHLKKNRNDDGTLNKAAQTLPDEKPSEDEIKFAPGFADAMIGTDESGASKATAEKLVSFMKKIAHYGDEQSQYAFYKEVIDNEHIIGVIDQFLENLAQSGLPIDPYLYGFANDLATKTANRNAVKVGIAMLGLCQYKKPIEDIKILGLHDEFTVYATVAIANISDNRVHHLWDLAKRVDGWGKIQLVDRLAEMELTQEVRDWLVTDGYKNSIMYEYLALTCAIHGRLSEKLNAQTIDDKLYSSASDIIVALMDESPAVGMSGYQDACETIEHFIRHSKNRNLNISNFITLHRLKDYLEELPEDREVLNQWSQNELSDSLIDINALLHAKDWTADVKTALQSADNTQYWNGKQAAKKLGIDLWDTVWEKLQKNPLNYSAWYDVTENAKERNIDEIIDFAIQNLPLELLGSGPKDSMGFGEHYQKHAALDSLVTLLKNHPGKGEKLILVALDSPVTRNRNMAIRTLAKWKTENWSSELSKKLNRLKEIEPNENTKANLERLLNGEELE